MLNQKFQFFKRLSNKIVESSNWKNYNGKLYYKTNIDKNVKLGENVILNEVTLKGNVIIGSNCKINSNVRISGSVKIGDFTSINGPSTEIFSGINNIEIGKFCSIARMTVIQEFYHDHSRLSTYYMQKHFFNGTFKDDVISKGNIQIGNDVWIGSQCTILSGVKIGNGVVVGAHSLINKDIPDYSIVVGSPARIIGYRFSNEIIEKLLEIKWWNWDVEKIKKNPNLFKNKLTLEDLNNL
jgi:acetyltransferase-like isoleucine patch superfamily enzyme